MSHNPLNSYKVQGRNLTVRHKASAVKSLKLDFKVK